MNYPLPICKHNLQAAMDREDCGLNAVPPIECNMKISYYKTMNLADKKESPRKSEDSYVFLHYTLLNKFDKGICFRLLYSAITCMVNSTTYC
jgi:hypothetical protein